MGLKIYNSLSNKIEEFIPIHEGKVNMYVCGPTVYNHIHIGNARPVVFYDMLKNYLEFLGYDVTYASKKMCQIYIIPFSHMLPNQLSDFGNTHKQLRIS